MPLAIPAATVVIIRQSRDDLEVLMLRRNQQLSFAGGLWVFPGGKIEPHELANHNEEVASMLAAIRETKEETGLDISHNKLYKISHWTAPETSRKRFATWFYLTVISPDQSEPVQVDGNEIHEYRWMRPDSAVKEQDAGKLALLPPTYVTLIEMQQHRHAHDIINFYQRRPFTPVLPKSCIIDNKPAILYPDDAGYATANPNTAGRRHRCIKDANIWRYENS